MLFFLILNVILIVFRLVRRHLVPGNDAFQLRQRNSKMKIVRVTITSVSAMMLSWAPYCLVSLVSVVNGKPEMENWEAEIPKLLAKASVIYNPFIYTFMNNRFRATLRRILRCRRFRVGVQLQDNREPIRNVRIPRNGGPRQNIPPDFDFA